MFHCATCLVAGRVALVSSRKETVAPVFGRDGQDPSEARAGRCRSADLAEINVKMQSGLVAPVRLR
jgi:hypothetical protein